jgi:Raf kinase inhibitor-like YbhB/YbcL family protein
LAAAVFLGFSFVALPLAGQDTANPWAAPVEDRDDSPANPNAAPVENDEAHEAGEKAALAGETDPLLPVDPKAMRLGSIAFEPGGMIPNEHSFNGGNVSPPLTITGVPERARSLALVCEDPDAPRGAPWIHWVVWNIAPNTGHIAKGQLPPAAQVGSNSWGRNEWGGPAPPSGTHRYVFTLYAMSEILELPISTDASQLKTAMEGKVLATATLIGRFSAPDR